MIRTLKFKKLVSPYLEEMMAVDFWQSNFPQPQALETDDDEQKSMNEQEVEEQDKNEEDGKEEQMDAADPKLWTEDDWKQKVETR